MGKRPVLQVLPCLFGFSGRSEKSGYAQALFIFVRGETTEEGTGIVIDPVLYVLYLPVRVLPDVFTLLYPAAYQLVGVLVASPLEAAVRVAEIYGCAFLPVDAGGFHAFCIGKL